VFLVVFPNSGGYHLDQQLNPGPKVNYRNYPITHNPELVGKMTPMGMFSRQVVGGEPEQIKKRS